MRFYDGKRGWRRRGWVVQERRLLDVRERRLFTSSADLCALLPETLDDGFDTADLAEHLHVRRRLAQQMAYCLRECGALTMVGKQGNCHPLCAPLRLALRNRRGRGQARSECASCPTTDSWRHKLSSASNSSLIAMQADTLFVSDHAGRLLFVNEPYDPKGNPAPLVFVGQSDDGFLCRFRHDIPQHLCDQVEQIVETYRTNSSSESTSLGGSLRQCMQVAGCETWQGVRRTCLSFSGRFNARPRMRRHQRSPSESVAHASWRYHSRARS